MLIRMTLAFSQVKAMRADSVKGTSALVKSRSNQDTQAIGAQVSALQTEVRAMQESINRDVPVFVELDPLPEGRRCLSENADMEFRYHFMCGASV